jgi:hypothetical protein
VLCRHRMIHTDRTASPMSNAHSTAIRPG